MSSVCPTDWRWPSNAYVSKHGDNLLKLDCRTTHYYQLPNALPLNFAGPSPYPKGIPPESVKKTLALNYVEVFSEYYDDLDEAEPPCCSQSTVPGGPQ